MCRAPPPLATDAALAEGAARTDAVKKAILNSPVAAALAKAAEERRAAAEKRAAQQAAAAERAAKAAAEQAAAEKAAAEKAAAEKAAAEKAEREKVAAEKAAAWRAIRAERDPKLTNDVATANDCSKVRRFRPEKFVFDNPGPKKVKAAACGLGRKKSVPGAQLRALA